ncbi:MFS transporter [Vitiosangium sp. GDMCC 1.1324]|uniref:MFS transporter n=1 Tax=Vitiosangium sp. (strain GDMCC 1.1324) TaxID=2138576 RepID=UPI000D34703A|nr:MFS transporter [Vitiosangium sp. GDMCC 1.1324]PTL75498.1 MFS transporter [Vitiosangium sp. GDMCC 1.1324]
MAARGWRDSGWRFLWRALGHRNYRLFFIGQSVSLVGTWLTRVAASWLVYRLSGSALLLGVVGFCGQIPTFVLAPFAGVLVDRWNRHRLLVVTQVLSMLQSFALAALSLAGVIEVWHVAVLMMVQGLINAFDVPGRQAFVVEMVEDRADLPNAIALNSSMFNAARLLGPSVAGGLIAWVGEGGCFLLDGVSYLAVIASLLAMRMTWRETHETRRALLEELKEGFVYAFHFPPIRAMLLLLAVVSLMGMPYTVLMPVMASNVLKGGPSTLGFLMAATGLGALSGAGYLASRRTVRGFGKVIVATASLFGGGLIAFALSRSVVLSLAALVATGYGMMVTTAACNTLLQTIVEERMRGRVMSFYAMAFMGTAPFGSLLAGALAARIGAPATIAVGGVVCLVAAAWFYVKLPSLRKLVRPIYERLGILPEVATGMREGATQMDRAED